MVSPIRILVLLSVFSLLLIGSLSGYLDEAVDTWQDLKTSVRLTLTIVFGWPLVAFVSPLLVKMWGFVSEQVVGLGGEYFIEDTSIQLLLVLIATTVAQTAFLTVKLNQLEDEA